MSCESLVRDASSGVAASLRAVDCVSAEATTSAFSRLFGTHGALLPALTVLLTLYVVVFALLLLTGRARLSLGSLTPRMITLGLVLTFTTSSVAYQSVVWNMAIGAPDQIAGVLLGAKGPATQLFADRIDIIFNAIAETASTVSPAGGAPRSGGTFSAESLMWLGALLLMLGTVGVLVTARIALAVLLAVGPVFICLALFRGSRGLFVGWLRAVALTAFTPLFAVLGGALMTELAAPVVVALRGTEGIDGRAAMALFVIAAVHCALMSLALRVASTMVAGWSVFGLGEAGKAGPSANLASATSTFIPGAVESAAPRTRALVNAVTLGGAASAPLAGASAAQAPRGVVVPNARSGFDNRPSERLRSRGIGSRFSSPAPTARKGFL